MMIYAHFTPNKNIETNPNHSSIPTQPAISTTLLAKPRGRLLRQLATAVVEPGLGPLFSDGFSGWGAMS
jgi:hypothetical protein